LDCQKLGTFNGVAPVLHQSTFFNYTDGFSFSGGPVVGFSLVNAFFQDASASAIALDLDNAIFLDFEVLNIIFTGTGTCINSSIGGANFILGIEAEIANNTFGLVGTMTPISGLTNGFQTNQWRFTNNSPVTQTEDTRSVADQYLLTTNTVTIGTIGQFEEIGTPGAGAWASDISDRFTAGADGTLTYTGDRNVDVEIIATAGIEKSGGGTDQLEGRIAINWVSPSGGLSKSMALTENSTPTSITMVANVVLSPNDNIRLIFTNNNSTSDVVVQHAKIDIVGK